MLIQMFRISSPFPFLNARQPQTERPNFEAYSCLAKFLLNYSTSTHKIQQIFSYNLFWFKLEIE